MPAPLLRPRVRDERGLVLPTRLLALCISCVAMAGLVFIANDPDGPAEQAATPATARPTAPATSQAPVVPTPSATPTRPAIERGDVFVEVFNNTRTRGLAGEVATKAKSGGWNVVGSDNWYGTVEGTTVYFPPRLREAGQALARDLGIKRVQPAEEPMRFDRLTVILTDDYR